MNKITLDFDDMIKVRELISKYFPNRKVMLEVYNDLEDENLEVWITILISEEYNHTQVEQLYKVDDEMYDLNLLGKIHVDISYV